jgi:valyl-tRNA synthetase
VVYQIEGLDEFLEVDTTRPETIFGDVAVAVHPCDERYHRFHGKHVIHPLTGEPLPIVLDDKLVNMELGTGVVKITPAHDPKDFECGQRHNLPEKEVIDLDGKMCGDIHPSFHGLDRFEAREKILEEVETRGLYVGKTDHPTALQLCSRSGTVIEPLLMPQWFVDCGKMGSRAASNVRECEITIEPAQHTHTWFRFLDNIQDWCVSRQIWWGHRIPAYKIKGYDDEWVVGRSIDDALEKAQAKFNRKFQPSDLKQDEDVLDTWFSSALLPLSATSWSEKSSGEIPTQSKGTYPLTVMETGYDILFFWVARMAMLCEELSGKVPFEKVLLHPMVRDKAGRKMSKSLGNVIDPLHVIDGVSYDDLLLGLQKGNVGVRELAKAEKELKREFPKGIPTCGADALRFTMASYLQQGRQINMDVQRVVSYRHFCNKIWNAVRYAIPLLGTSAKFERGDLLQGKTKMSLADRWILSKMANAVIACNSGLQSNHLANSVAALQKFFVQELCDVYIELSKPVLYGNRIRVHENTPQEELDARQQSAQAVLHFCLDYSMRLLHPFIPFVTEELWQRIRVSGPASDALQTDSILTARFPEESDVSIWIDDVAESEMKV